MAAPTRQTMRLLSPRLLCGGIGRSACAGQIRRATTGRYSNPGSVPKTATTTTPPSVNADGLDPLAARQNAIEMAQWKSFHTNRMRVAGLGLISTMAATVLMLYNLDLDEMNKDKSSQGKRSGQQLDANAGGNEKFQGKEVHVVGLGSDKRIVAEGDGVQIDLVETGTSSVPHFPRTIFLPDSLDASQPDVIQTARPNTSANPGNVSNQEEYTLVGLGIRTVLFIQVYVVGLYVRTQDITSLQAKLVHAVNESASTLVPAEKEELKRKLLDPLESRALWSELLKVPGLKTAWRISPTRNTDFGHLRDGFVNGIRARISETQRLNPGQETEYDAEDFGQSVQSLKRVFGGGKAPKGSVLILARDRRGTLDVLYQPEPEKNGSREELKRIGTVEDERISRLIWMGYLAGDKVSSKAARDGVANGCITFATRPIGSVEARVI